MNKKILVVDDVYPNRYLIEEIFSEYEVSGVSNGKEMRNMLKTMKPDLILMDVNLPDEDGYELTKELKAGATTKNIPVIFITVHNTKMDVLHAVKAGGVDFVTKPFVESELRERVEKALRDSFIDNTTGGNK